MSTEDSKSRSGRFDLPANELVEAFNATITFEQRVLPVRHSGQQGARHDARPSEHHQHRGRRSDLPRP